MLFTKKTNAETSTMQDVKDAILAALGNEEPGTPSYETLIHELERVEAMLVKNPSWQFKPTADVLISASVSLVSILAILRHEEFNVITSKAMSFLPKLLK